MIIWIDNMSQDISGKTGFQLKPEWIKGQLMGDVGSKTT